MLLTASHEAGGGSIAWRLFRCLPEDHTLECAGLALQCDIPVAFHGRRGYFDMIFRYESVACSSALGRSDSLRRNPASHQKLLCQVWRIQVDALPVLKSSLLGIFVLHLDVILE
jgi:hypothetical protein